MNTQFPRATTTEAIRNSFFGRSSREGALFAWGGRQIGIPDSVSTFGVPGNPTTGSQPSLKHLSENLRREICRRKVAEEKLSRGEHQYHELLRHVRELSRQVLLAQEEERMRISRDLHDVIAQTLTGINLRLATLKVEAVRNPAGLNEKISTTQRLVEDSINIVHRFARELRPVVLDDLGLVPALRNFAKAFSEQMDIQVNLSAFVGVERMESGIRTVLFRVAQEALNNVAKHAQASRVRVTIQKVDNAVVMKIKDNGKGFLLESRSPYQKHKRLGLIGMKERLELIGGQFTVESTLSQGTTVRAKIPLSVNTRLDKRLIKLL